MHDTVAAHGHHQIALADVPSGHEVVGMPSRIAGPPVMKASTVHPSSSIRRRTSGHALPQRPSRLAGFTITCTRAMLGSGRGEDEGSRPKARAHVGEAKQQPSRCGLKARLNSCGGPLRSLSEVKVALPEPARGLRAVKDGWPSRRVARPSWRAPR